MMRIIQTVVEVLKRESKGDSEKIYSPSCYPLYSMIEMKKCACHKRPRAACDKCIFSFQSYYNRNFASSLVNIRTGRVFENFCI